MPAARKISWAQLRVGLMALAALIVVAALVFVMSGSKRLFARTVTLYTYMDDAVGLTPSAPVRLNGILAGKVNRVELSGESNPQRVIRIVMDIDTAMLQNIPVDSVASLSAENLLGTKFINIRRGQSNVAVKSGGAIAALDTKSFDELLAQSYNLLAEVQGIVKRVDSIVGLIESGRGSIGKLLVDEELYNRVLSIVTEFQGLARAIASPRGTVGKLIYDDAVYRQVEGTLTRVDTIVADLQNGKGSAGKLLTDDQLYNELRDSVQGVHKIVDDLNAGKGTAGKLLKDEQLHNDLRASLNKVDGILDKINSGQGTIGQLLVNQQLYDTLNGATAELRDLVKAVRQDPKKYLRIKFSLF